MSRIITLLGLLAAVASPLAEGLKLINPRAAVAVGVAGAVAAALGRALVEPQTLRRFNPAALRRGLPRRGSFAKLNRGRVKSWIAAAVLFLSSLTGLPPFTSAQALMPELVQFPSPEVEFVVGPQLRSGSEPLASWYDETAARQAKFWAEKFLAEPLLVVSNHYDLPLCLYTEFYRTGDEEYLRLARAVAAKWYAGPHVREGLPVGGGDIPSPMYADSPVSRSTRWTATRRSSATSTA